MKQALATDSGRRRIAVYGEINANLVDGSAIWLRAVATMLASIPGNEVTVLLRAADERGVVTGPMRKVDRLTLVPPLGDGERLLSPERALDELVRLDRATPFDIVILRGAGVIEAAIAQGAFRGRLWTYYVPPNHEPTTEDRSRLRALADGSERILCQTDAIRDLVGEAADDAREKALLLPPMVERSTVERSPPTGARLLELVYAGKLSPEYFAEEMLDLAERLERTRPGRTRLHVAGDKVHMVPTDPDFRERVTRRLSGTPGVVWHGALDQAATRALIESCGLALSIRRPELANSREISTKILEYGAGGCGVLLNRTAQHVRLLGADYPLYAEDVETAVDLIVRCVDEPDLLQAAAETCRAASEPFLIDRVAEEFEAHLAGTLRRQGRSARLLVAGHDLKFLGEIPDVVRRRGGVVEFDRWVKHTGHDETASLAALAAADTVFCEWCLGNAVWYSEHVRPEQRLIVRFHRMELDTPYPARVVLDRVHRMVFVAEHVREAAIERFGWTDSRRLEVIPNAVVTSRFDRPKLPGATFNLGLVGYVPALKRLDRALDILELLRAGDPRYRLLCKGRPPWEYDWMHQRPGERRYYESLYRRLAESELLHDSVVFEPPGDDVPTFLQKVRFILSVSDVEGHAVAPAEGMAAGCIPVVVDRPGARDQYPSEWVHFNERDAANAIRRTVDGGSVGEAAAKAKRLAAELDPTRLDEAWARLLVPVE